MAVDLDGAADVWSSKMKMVLISSAVAVAIAVVAYVILTNSGMDTASVYSGPDVRL